MQRNVSPSSAGYRGNKSFASIVFRLAPYLCRLSVSSAAIDDEAPGRRSSSSTCHRPATHPWAWLRRRDNGGGGEAAAGGG
jgi:hypothetical protein